MTRHFFFHNEENGEDFIVGAEDLTDAREIVEDIFGDDEVEFCYEMSELEAEMSGLDEY